MERIDEIHEDLKNLLGFDCVIVKLETYNDLVTKLEQAEKALKFYADWQTHHKLSFSAKETPYDVDRGKFAARTLQAIRGNE